MLSRRNLFLICLCWTSIAVFGQGNLLPNGSFEVGLQGWSFSSRGAGGYPSDIRTMMLDPQPKRVKAADAPDGQFVFEYQVPAEVGITVVSRCYAVKPGKYTFSLQTRSKGLSLKIHGASGIPTSQEIPASAGWKKTQIAFTVDKDTKFLALQFSMGGPQRIQMDEIKLSAVDSASPPYSVETGLATTAADGVWFAKDRKEIVVRLFSRQNQSGKMIYRIENAWGKEMTTGEVPATLSANQVFEKQIEVNIPDTGHYRVLAQFQNGTTILSDRSELLFGVVPNRTLPTSLDTGSDSHFGVNMRTRPYLMKLAQKMGVRWTFCAPPLFTKWHTTEPKKGMWLFYDDLVKMLSDHGIHVCGNLADAPFWATDVRDKDKYGGPWPNASLPLDWTDWEKYVKTVTSHYYPRIKYWAVWNEPDHEAFIKTKPGETWVDVYLTILKHTYPVAKSVNPDIQVLGGTTTHYGSLLPLIQAGGLKYCDGLSFHWASWTPQGYLRNTAEERGWLGTKGLSSELSRFGLVEKNTEEGMRGEMWAAMKKAGKRVPYWDTECHLTQAPIKREYVTQPDPPKSYSTPYMTPIDSANAAVRQNIAEWASGVEKTFAWLFETTTGPWESRTDQTLIEWDRAPTAALAAYAVMTEKLEGAKFLKWETKTDDQWLDKSAYWIFTFKKPDGRLRVVWSNSDTAHEFLLPVDGKKVIVSDMFGVECSGTNLKSGLELKGNVNLSPARSPIYVWEHY